MALKIGKYSAWLELRGRKGHEQLRNSAEKNQNQNQFSGRSYGNMRDEISESDLDSGREYQSPMPGFKSGNFFG